MVLVGHSLGGWIAASTNDPEGVFAGRVPTGLDAAFEAARAREGQSLGGFVPGPSDPGLAGRLADIRGPVLILWGDADRLIPVEHLDAWRRALPPAEWRVFPGLAHLMFTSRPRPSRRSATSRRPTRAAETPVVAAGNDRDPRHAWISAPWRRDGEARRS